MLPDFETCYAAMQSRDTRFDGAFFVAVATTKIYCRPSCPAMTSEADERALLPHGGGGAGGRLSRLPALPPRRRARLSRLEPALRRGERAPCASSATAWWTARGSRGSPGASPTARDSSAGSWSTSSAPARSTWPGRSAPTRRGC